MDNSDSNADNTAVITEVSGPTNGWYGILTDKSWGIGIAEQYDDDEPHGVVPKVGDRVRTYGSLGRPVRGISINDHTVFYRTPVEQEAFDARERERMRQQHRDTFERERPNLDAQYAALPDVFRDRIDRFRTNNPDFRWEYESYELFCCTEAVKLAKELRTAAAAEHYAGLARSETFSANREQWDRELDEQRSIDKAAGLSGDHSGNTHGAAGALAYWYLTQSANVVKMHGALAPLVGSVAYGDVPQAAAPCDGAGPIPTLEGTANGR